MLRPDLSDYSDAYVVVKVSIRSCPLQISDTFFGNAEDLVIAMPMYNFWNTVTVIL